MNSPPSHAGLQPSAKPEPISITLTINDEAYTLDVAPWTGLVPGAAVAEGVTPSEARRLRDEVVRALRSAAPNSSTYCWFCGFERQASAW